MTDADDLILMIGTLIVVSLVVSAFLGLFEIDL